VLGVGRAPLGERREQTVDEAAELAAGIVVGVDLGDGQLQVCSTMEMAGCDRLSMHQQTALQEIGIDPDQP
jgi:hypothetical protein